MRNITFKESKSEIYNEIGKLIKPVKSTTEGLEIVRNPKMPYAYITNSFHLQYAAMLHGTDSYHLPPTNEDSTLFVDSMAIPMGKDFPYKKEFNKV